MASARIEAKAMYAAPRMNGGFDYRLSHWKLFDLHLDLAEGILKRSGRPSNCVQVRPALVRLLALLSGLGRS